MSTVSEISALVVGDSEAISSDIDIIVESHSGQFNRISELNAAYLCLQYPLLFSFGEDGYREDIPLNGILINHLMGGNMLAFLNTFHTKFKKGRMKSL